MNCSGSELLNRGRAGGELSGPLIAGRQSDPKKCLRGLVFAQQTGILPEIFAPGIRRGVSLPLRAPGTFRVGLLVPRCGAAGIWGPSSIASAEVAMDELNERDGIAGQQGELVIIDSAEEAETAVERTVGDLIERGGLDAIVGMHISSVRQRLKAVVRGRIPYVYTPLYEGGEDAPEVFAIGDTPMRQLGPAMTWLHCRRKIRNWALIGNDYVWPRASHAFAKAHLASSGCRIVHECYLPFAVEDLDRAVQQIADSGADAVLVSLVGQDAVDFNRIFGAMDLDRRMIRLSCAIEENGLLASGAENLKRLYCSSSYFGILTGEKNARFRERYHGVHGDRAPQLNALGQSTYEGMHFLASLMRAGNGRWPRPGRLPLAPISYRSARQGIWESNRSSALPAYLARADGLQFDIVAQVA